MQLSNLKVTAVDESLPVTKSVTLTIPQNAPVDEFSVFVSKKENSHDLHLNLGTPEAFKVGDVYTLTLTRNP